MPLPKIFSLSFLFVLLCSCVVQPTFTQAYDKKCQVVKQKVELSVEQVKGFDQLNCSSSHDCKAQFLGQVVGAAIFFPLSAIISGSIAVVGNSIYWLKEQGQCAEVN